MTRRKWAQVKLSLLELQLCHFFTESLGLCSLICKTGIINSVYLRTYEY